MGATSEVEQEERRRKPWMQIKVRGLGGFLVMGGALIAAGLGAAFAAHRAHVNNKRSNRSATTKPADEGCKGISCNGEGGGQLDEVEGDAARGLASLLALDSTPIVKLAEDWQPEFSDDIPQVMIEQSPSFKHLEISVATDVRAMETDTTDDGDSAVLKFSLGGSESGIVENQKEQSSEESELINFKELKEEEFSFSVVEFTKIQDKNSKNLEESDFDRVRDKEEGEEEQEFSFRSVESDTMQNQTKQTLEETRITHAREQEGGGEESNDDAEAPSSESQEDETQSTTKGESEIQEEGSDGTGDSSNESSAEAVWPAEVIEQEKGSLSPENHQEITEESNEENVTAVKFAEKVAAAEQSVSVGKKIGAGPKTMNYSNRILLLLLALALALTLISFAHRDHLHGFCLAKLYHHLHQVFFPSNNAM